MVYELVLSLKMLSSNVCARTLRAMGNVLTTVVSEKTGGVSIFFRFCFLGVTAACLFLIFDWRCETTCFFIYVICLCFDVRLTIFHTHV